MPVNKFARKIAVRYVARQCRLPRRLSFNATENQYFIASFFRKRQPFVLIPPRIRQLPH